MRGKWSPVRLLLIDYRRYNEYRLVSIFFFLNDPPTTDISTLPLHDALPIYIIEGATGGPRELPARPFDYAALKSASREAGGQGAWMVNTGYDRDMALRAVENGHADIVA